MLLECLEAVIPSFKYESLLMALKCTSEIKPFRAIMKRTAMVALSSGFSNKLFYLAANQGSAKHTSITRLLKLDSFNLNNHQGKGFVQYKEGESHQL